MLTHTEYTAKFETTIRGRTYKVGEAIDDPEIPPYVLNRLISNRRVAIRISPAEPVGGAVEAREPPAPSEYAETMEPAQAAGREPLSSYHKRWISAHKKFCRRMKSAETFKAFITRAAVDHGLTPDGRTEDILSVLQEHEVLPI